MCGCQESSKSVNSDLDLSKYLCCFLDLFFRMNETASSPLIEHLVSKVGRLTSENRDISRRLETMTERWREVVMQLRYSMRMCDSLREEVRKKESVNGKLLGVYKKLCQMLKARQKLLMEAETKYQESLEQYGWREEDLAKPREMALRLANIIDNLNDVTEVIFMTSYILSNIRFTRCSVYDAFKVCTT